jgi:hypothetical protein
MFNVPAWLARVSHARTNNCLPHRLPVEGEFDKRRHRAQRVLCACTLLNVPWAMATMHGIWMANANGTVRELNSSHTRAKELGGRVWCVSLTSAPSEVNTGRSSLMYALLSTPVANATTTATTAGRMAARCMVSSERNICSTFHRRSRMHFLRTHDCA